MVETKTFVGMCVGETKIIPLGFFSGARLAKWPNWLTRPWSTIQAGGDQGRTGSVPNSAELTWPPRSVLRVQW